MDKKTLLYSAEEIMHVVDEALSIPPDPNAKNIYPTINDHIPVFHPKDDPVLNEIYEEPEWTAQDTLQLIMKMIPLL